MNAPSTQPLPEDLRWGPSCGSEGSCPSSQEAEAVFGPANVPLQRKGVSLNEDREGMSGKGRNKNIILKGQCFGGVCPFD